ncbi:MAG: DUF547 domain-containing protein [Pseudomonadales bacterium]|nr:DUF547 domain-containing protein [Pseudomonadales bacterium]
MTASRLAKSLFLCILSLAVEGQAQVDHSLWDGLLANHVRVLRSGQATQLDYQGVAAERSELATYLAQLSAVSRTEFEGWSHSHQLAFLINSYNAWTVELILDEGPDIASIRDIGFLPNAAWRRDFIPLFGEQVSLDDIEHGMIRGWGRYNEPRIHFAVNCAAVGCPALRGEAYDGDRLEDQLEQNTQLFLSDRTRNYRERNRLYISRIFDWYEEDFEEGWLGVQSVAQFLMRYSEQLGLTHEDFRQIEQRQLRIRYADYDWRLNRVPDS